MSEYQLSLQKREITGKKTKKLRAEGLIPSVIYGVKDPILAASEYNPTEKVLRTAGYHSPIELDVDGKKQLVIAKNVSIDPTSRRILNVEFQAISKSDVVEAIAPITVVNFENSGAAKLHLALLPVIEEIAIKAKPSDLPSELLVDANPLENAGNKLMISDIELPKGVEFVNKDLDPETVIANVYDPAAEAAAREAADENAAEAEAGAEEAAEAATGETEEK